MIKLEDAEQRNKKIIQQRFGVSAIYDTIPNSTLNKEICKYIKIIDNMFPNCFLWYPNRHMTLIRCESVRFPLRVSSNEDFYKEMKKELMILPKIRLKYTYSKIDSDGVIRCFFAEIDWEDLYAVKKFYMNKGLNYTMIENPWIALGNIKIEKFNDVKMRIENLKDVVNEINISDIVIDVVDFIYYEDVLLRKSQCIGREK